MYPPLAQRRAARIGRRYKSKTILHIVPLQLSKKFTIFVLRCYPGSSLAMASNEVDPSARSIALDGLPLAIVVISLIFFIASIITVSLRTYIRLKKGIFGLEDTFMVIGTVSEVSKSDTCAILTKSARSHTYPSLV